jgi:hypothetical protein
MPMLNYLAIGILRRTLFHLQYLFLFMCRLRPEVLMTLLGHQQN